MFLKDYDILFLDESDQVIVRYRVTELPIKEETILSKSMEYFNDPEPCMIHRSAVLKRLYMDMDEYLYHHLREANVSLLWREFPEKYRDSLDIKGSIYRVQLRAISQR